MLTSSTTTQPPCRLLKIGHPLQSLQSWGGQGC
jgi:hypothetical protein